jgi:ABC-type Zn uptake system ZnuABC Zn-binding protein ZnuA
MISKNSFIIYLLITSALLIVMSLGCSKKRDSDTRPVVCVTNSWLECAVKDIAGETVRIARLLPPGHCPGQFDLSLKQLEDIRNCDLLLRFHFQSGMDSAFRAALKEGAEICSVNIGEGQCLPGTYLSSAKEVCNFISGKFPEKKSIFENNLKKLETRLDVLSANVKDRAGEFGIIGKNIVCSQHQAVFCRWLGLNVIAEFPDLTDVAASDVADILEKVGNQKADFIVGNLQGGSAFALALGGRFNAPIIVLSNFPNMIENESTFDQLVLNNVGKFIMGEQE